MTSARSAARNHTDGEVRPGPIGAALRRPGADSWLWPAYLGSAMILTGLYFALPAYHLGLWTSLGLSSVAATLVGAARYQPHQPAAWYLLAGAEFTFIAGDTTYNVLTDVLHQINPFPSIADVFYLLTYPLLAGAVYLFIRGRSSIRDPASLIDAIIITTGLGLLSWVYLVVPSFQADGLTLVQRFISVAYPVGDVLVLAMLARLVASGGLRIPSMRFLVLGAVGLMTADVLYGLAQLNGRWQVGGPIDSGWVLCYVAFGCAALHPSMVRLDEIQPRPDPRMGPLRFGLLASVSLIGPAVLLTESLTGARVQAGTVALFSATLFVLVLVRLWGILHVHQQSLARERMLRSSSEALVGAQSVANIYQIALDGVRALTGANGAVYLVRPGGITCVLRSGDPRHPERLEQLWLAAQAGGALSAARTLSVNPLRYDLEVRGMLVVDSDASLTLDQHGALATLAAQVALAAESAHLAEALRRRRAEEQFQGLLQNTSDIIVIVDSRGEITYGTPSLARNLGRSAQDVVGHDLAEFLHQDDAAEAIEMFAGFAASTTQVQTIADWRLCRRDGSLVAFEVLSNNLLEDPRVGGIVLTMRDVSERRELEAQLQHQAFHDTLTGLANRALFQDRAEHALARTARIGNIVAMLMLDLDNFKAINDTRGYPAGDELLQQVAARLQSTLRAGATVSRLGGDEFAILVEDLIDVRQAERFAERVLDHFAEPFTVSGEILNVRISVGLVVSGATHEWLDMTGLMRCADLALDAAKERGKGQIVLYHPDLNTRMLDRLTRRSDLERALDARQFVLQYQPIVSIETGAVIDCEALVRWQHPTRGLVAPLDFIPLAEETGLIVDLGLWVLDEACAQLRCWADAGSADLEVSVNVSARQLRETNFVEDVRSAMLRHGTPAGRLVLELTESIFALDAPAISAQLRALRVMGIKIAMDDFGTGYSSLSYLQKFQLDILKIDKSFVDELGEQNGDGSSLVSAIISLAHSLRLEVIAEGIERVAQRDELWSMGCTLGQGYLYSRPVDADHMTDLLASSSILGPQISAPAKPVRT